MSIKPDATIAVVVDELETILLDLAPTEAISVTDYVLQPEAFEETIRDRPLSFLGANEATLIGPFILSLIVQIAWDYVGEVKKAAIGELAKKSIGYLIKKLGLSPRTPPPTKECALQNLTEALVASGWKRDLAMRAALNLWEAGTRMGEELIKIHNKE